MASLTGQSIASSYEQLLSLPDGGGNGTTLVDITDGDGVTTFSLKLAQYHAEIRGTTGTGATGAGKLNLSTAELTVVDNDVLGKIDFLAPLESSGTDAILAGASIWGEAEDTFAADNNSTALVFATNTSAAATERMRISANGTLTVGSDGSGYDVVFNSATAGDNFTWDSSEEKLTITGTSGAVALDIHTGKATFGDAGTTYATINQNTLLFSSANGDIGTSSAHSVRIKTNNTVRTTIDSNGAMTNTSQPAVQAVANATSSNENLAINSTTTITFDREVFDQGSDFASDTTFTAPVAGKYQVNFTTKLLNVDENADYIAIYITTSNRMYTTQWDNADLFDADAAYHSINLSDLVDMDASDTLTVGIRQNGGTNQMDLEGDSSASVTRLSIHLVC